MNSNDENSAAIDRRYLDAALRLARRHEGMTGTNPSVVCLLVRDDGEGSYIIGSGITARGGRPHAEPIALAEVGSSAKGATAYVTLEPCAHHGRTPPCAQTLIDAGVTRVVTAIVDPDARVNGKGHATLENAGIEVVQIDGGNAASRVMQGYLKMRSSNNPFVTLKLAMTNEGVMGVRDKQQVRITGSESKAQTHLMRARHDAILVGIGTVLSDDPGLTCRLPGLEARSPIRVVLDAGALLEAQHQLVSSAHALPTFAIAPNDVARNWQDMLAKHGVSRLACELDGAHIALPELLDDLAAKGIQSVMVEGGSKVAESFLKENLVDEIMLYVGGEPEVTNIPKDAVIAPFTPDNLPEGFEIREELRFGSDLCLRLCKVAG